MQLLLVDDNPLFLEGLQNLLECQGHDVLDIARSGPEALTSVERCQPDAVLMDLDMPGMDGIETTRQLKARWPALPVVMMTQSENASAIYEALGAGATGYLVKGQPASTLLANLHQLERGAAPLSPGLAERFLEELDRRRHLRAIMQEAVRS